MVELLHETQAYTWAYFIQTSKQNIHIYVYASSKPLVFCPEVILFFVSFILPVSVSCYLSVLLFVIQTEASFNEKLRTRERERERERERLQCLSSFSVPVSFADKLAFRHIALLPADSYRACGTRPMQLLFLLSCLLMLM
jgi:hypothetical protein